ncbi:MarR family winged helix-turn-helix transcriptional regulator [Effusibacillus dendaii]|uniref:HTH marR-type domain-containing protein n=1 Tax=Effusibacillus dendaii TaxID=2743772 RepID=A0A7I8DFT7_9BACL|nr:MarR family transcriptional regulator [Effusibacillus dendaii]BCJ87809.1 hypothetical protein skT53_27940 [Effusibacillus dendaii]
MSATEIRQLLRKINRQITHIANRELARFCITVPQILVLKEVLGGPKMIGQISEAVNLSNSTVSGIVDRLEKQGLVERRRDLDDRRAVWIFKTEKFEEIKNQIPVLRDDYFSTLLEGLSQTELDTVVRTLQLLSNHLEEKDGKQQ